MSNDTIENLDEYLVPGSETVYYIPDYISQADHDLLLKWLVERDKKGWNELPNRSVKRYGGDVTPTGLQNKQELPKYLQPLAQRIYDDFIVSMMPNHMLINAYAPGDGIMPHTDGPAYHPEVAWLNLGTNSLLAFWENRVGKFETYLNSNRCYSKQVFSKSLLRTQIISDFHRKILYRLTPWHRIYH